MTTPNSRRYEEALELAREILTTEEEDHMFCDAVKVSKALISACEEIEMIGNDRNVLDDANIRLNEQLTALAKRLEVAEGIVDFYARLTDERDDEIINEPWIEYHGETGEEHVIGTKARAYFAGKAEGE